jgi:GH24 family phage-related lysozyme (muramidase)
VVFKMPVNNYRITSKYNPNRKHPVTGKVQKHAGIDLVNKNVSLAPILATADGTVRLVKDTGNSGYGKYIIISHNIGGKVYESVYAHLHAFQVKQGQKVKQGERIATMGNSGIGTGIHLHFELHRGQYSYANGTYPTSFDPEPWVTPDKMNIAKPGLELVKKFEGFYNKAYRDVVNVPTIGYGLTKYPNGEAVKMSDTISQEEALVLVEQQINEHASKMFEDIKVPLTQNQFDALASFAYNLGSGIFKKDKALTAYINKKDWFNTVRVMRLYNKAGGKVFAGLEKRRQAETELFLKGLDANLYRQNEEEDKYMVFTNETTKGAVRELLKQAVDKKHIDKSWLEKFDKGNLTHGDYEGLTIIIQNKKALSK